MKSFLVTLTFFTRVPIRIDRQIKYQEYIDGIWWLPVISLIIGVPLYVASFAYAYIDTTLVSIIVLGIYLLTTGALHIDGLADTMDALGSNRDKNRMLMIMKDSSIGTFGVLAIVVYAIAMVAVLSVVDAKFLLIYPLVGRTVATIVARVNTYARDEGMGASFVNGAKVPHYLLGTGVFIAISYLLFGLDYMLIVASIAYAFTTICSILAARSIAKKLGGITGDVVGYIIEVSQVVFLYALVALNIIIIKG